MITLITLAALVTVIHRFGSTPTAIAIEEKVQASRDEHLQLMLRHGIVTGIIR
jgi:hypothetical protein